MAKKDKLKEDVVTVETKTLKVSDLKVKKEDVVTVEFIKDLALFKIGDTKVLPKSLANQLVKLENAKIIKTN
jgi:hypothetical protein